MDEVSFRAKQKLVAFRIRELKDVLTQLGLPKQGKKQVLMDKIMGVLTPPEKNSVSQKVVGRTSKGAVSREQCVHIIDDIYRKLRGAGANDVSPTGRRYAEAGSSSAARSEEADGGASEGESKIRCPCGSSKDQGTMIQCDDSTCGVWQHITCVVIPEKPNEGTQPEIPPQFYCELCRINRSDPFCTTLQTPMTGVKLNTSGNKSDGTNPLQSVDKAFHLSPADRDSAKKQNNDIQVWCILLNDKVPFRVHWPAHSDLRVNGVSVRVTNRPGQQLLGANGRDEGQSILPFVKVEGMPRISFQAYDARPFCLGVRVIRRNTLEQILAMIPDVNKGEEFDEALARVRRCINGGGQSTADDGDSDSDLEVVSDSIAANLRCPMSGSRIKTAGRFKPCVHMGCFDLHTFVELNQRARKWQCPICLKNYSLENLIIDPFINRLTTALKNHPEEVTEVELKADGQWRPKFDNEKSNREPWRLPDGSILPVANGPSLNEPRQPVAIKPVKTEAGISSHERGTLRLIKRASDGHWAINGGTKRLNNNGWASNSGAGPSQRPKPAEHPTILSRSTSATDSNDGEDGERSVNQEPSDKDKDVVHILDDNEVSFPPAKTSSKGTTWQSGGTEGAAVPPAPPAEIIYISDTDEDEDDDRANMRSSNASAYPSASNLMPAFKGNMPSQVLSLRTDQTSDDPVLASSSQTYSHVNSAATSKGQTMVEDRGPIGGAMGMPLEANDFWRSGSSVPYRYSPPLSEHPTSGTGSVNHPIRPTAVQAVAPTFGLATQQHREPHGSTRGSNWKSRWSPSRTYSNSDCNGVGGEVGNGASSPREPPLRLFLSPQPARAQVQPCLQPRMSSLEDDVDSNNWFSLRLGGGDSDPDPAPQRENHRVSETHDYLENLATTASEALVHMNGAHGAANSRSKMQTSPPYLSPVESLSPRSSPPFGRIDALSSMQPPSRTQRHRHYYRVESDSD